MPLLHAEHLSKTYHDGRKRLPVLRDASLAVYPGVSIALLGQSGSGKSTLLNILGGLERPDSGTLDIAGQTVAQLEEPELTRFRRKTIGYIYQLFNLIPTLSVAENIDLPLELLGLQHAERQRRIEHWLNAVGLSARASDYVDRLSGGEQQRIAIARALAPQPRLILADEPTGNLDAQTGRQVLELLFELTRESERSLILVTHSQVVAQNADRVLTLHEGRIVQGDSSQAW